MNHRKGKFDGLSIVVGSMAVVFIFICVFVMFGTFSDIATNTSSSGASFFDNITFIFGNIVTQFSVLGPVLGYGLIIGFGVVLVAASAYAIKLNGRGR